MRTFFILVALLAIVATRSYAERPNIIFILTDDQRYDTLGCTGNGFIKTPNLDQLAAEGTLFTNASVTSAICTPSRACYFLGQYERRHGVNFNSGTAMTAEAWSKSYPMVLRENGYFTGYVGKNHVPIGTEAYDSNIIDQSFDFWYAGHGHLSFYPKRRHEIFKHAAADTQTEIVGEGVSSFLSGQPGFIRGAEAFLKNRPTDKPFCLSIACNLPHGSSTSTMELLPGDPELYRTAYRDHLNQLALAPTYVARKDIVTPKLPGDVLLAEFRQTGYDYVDTPEKMKERIVREYQTITGIDRMVGEIRTTLQAAGVADNTIIVFSSDHGLMSGEWGLGGKALNYEICLRVPMIVMDPRVTADQRGRRSVALAQSIDIAPTLLDYADIEAPKTMQGKSLRPLVNGKDASFRQFAFAENLWSTYFGNPRIESVRDADWKYIRYFKNDRTQFADVTQKTLYEVTHSQVASYAEWLTASIEGEQPVYEELFNLASDPSEIVNLAGRSIYAKQLQRMRVECQRQVTLAKGDVNQPPSTIVVPSIKESKTKRPKEQNKKPGMQKGTSTRDPQESAALKRFRVEHESQWSDREPKAATTGINYLPAVGLGREAGIIRRDPTDIFKLGDTYFLWYSRASGGPLQVGVAKATNKLRAYPWDLCDIWLATSIDGLTWQEQGPAVVRGEPGTYDARSVFTPNVLVSKGRYYLFYQTAPNLDDPDPGDFKWTKIGMSWADSPYGPWHRATAPVLSHGDFDKGDWDGLVAHDPSVIERQGKYFLYYKSRYYRGPDERFATGDLKAWVKNGGIPIGWGVANADDPLGPYVKSELNPVIIGGHECIVWPYRQGVCALVTQGPEKNTIQFAEDGLNFQPIGTVKEAPIAAGIFRPDFSNCDPMPKSNWGISHVVINTDWHHLRRFEFTEELTPDN